MPPGSCVFFGFNRIDKRKGQNYTGAVHNIMPKVWRGQLCLCVPPLVSVAKNPAMVPLSRLMLENKFHSLLGAAASY